MVTRSTAERGAATRFGVGAGSQESAIPAVDNASKAAAAGVRNPTANESPPVNDPVELQGIFGASRRI